MSSYRQGRLDEENSSLLLQHIANTSDHHSAKVTVPVQIINYSGGSEVSGRFVLDTIGDIVQAQFFCDDDMVDTTQDILLTWIYSCVATDADLDIKRFQGACKTDDSEQLAWNIDAGTRMNTSVTQDNWNQAVYTYTAANVDGDDMVVGAFENEDANDVYVWGCYVTFYLK